MVPQLLIIALAFENIVQAKFLRVFVIFFDITPGIPIGIGIVNSVEQDLFGHGRTHNWVSCVAGHLIEGHGPLRVGILSLQNIEVING